MQFVEIAAGGVHVLFRGRNAGLETDRYYHVSPRYSLFKL
jgi:hypothetical protein